LIALVAAAAPAGPAAAKPVDGDGDAAGVRTVGAARKKQAPPRCVIGAIDLAVVPRLSLNAGRPPCARNYLALALGYGRAGELRGLQIALGAAAVERGAVGGQIALGVTAVGDDMRGVQLAGLVGAAGSRFTGIQISGLIGAAGDGASGIQIAGLVSASGGNFTGLQFASLFAAAGDEVTGVQLAGLINAAGKGATAFQIAGLGNASGGRTTGLQAALGFNAAGEGMRGLQLAGLFNAAGGEAQAVQLSGVFNAASRLRGIQVSGAMNQIASGEGLQLAGGYNRARHALTGVQIAAVNIGRDVDGAQVGLVNIARNVRGMQLGLVNVADRADAPVGVVSWMRSGERALEVWGGEALSLSAGVRLGTHRVYSLVGISSGPLVDGNPWGPVGGAGVKGQLGPLTLLVDALAHALFFDGVDDQALLAQARARLARDVTPRIAVSLGATWNVFVSGDRDGEDLPLGLDSLDVSGDATVRQWPGFTAGAALRW
jgi:hypothetical protein